MQDKQRDEVPPKVEEKVAKEIEVLPAAKEHQTSVDSEVSKLVILTQPMPNLLLY